MSIEPHHINRIIRPRRFHDVHPGRVAEKPVLARSPLLSVHHSTLDDDEKGSDTVNTLWGSLRMLRGSETGLHSRNAISSRDEGERLPSVVRRVIAWVEIR